MPERFSLLCRICSELKKEQILSFLEHVFSYLLLKSLLFCIVPNETIQDVAVLILYSNKGIGW